MKKFYELLFVCVFVFDDIILLIWNSLIYSFTFFISNYKAFYRSVYLGIIIYFLVKPEVKLQHAINW